MSYTFEDLIESVQSRPAIWQRSHPRYNNETRKLCWNQIAKELKTNEIRLRKSWKYLIDQYRKELKAKKQTTKNDSAKGVWVYYNKMAFLKEEIITRQRRRKIRSRTNSVTSNDSHEETTHNDSGSRMIDESILTPNGSQHGEIKTNTGIPATSNSKLNVNHSTPTHIKHPNPDTYDQYSGCNNTASKEIEPNIGKADLILQKLLNLSADKKDDDLMFFMSLLPMVKTLSHLKKLQLRGKINEWLLQMLSESDPLNNVEQNPVASEDNWSQSSEDNKDTVMLEIMGTEK